MTLTVAYISFVEQQADSDDDIIITMSGSGRNFRVQQRGVERLMYLSGRNFYAAMRFDGDEAAARAEAVAHAAERRAQLARLYA